MNCQKNLRTPPPSRNTKETQNGKVPRRRAVVPGRNSTPSSNPSTQRQAKAVPRRSGRMLRIHFAELVQPRDPGGRSPLRHGISETLRRIDLGNEPVPDETTICKFRHLLEANDLGERIFRKSTPTSRRASSRKGPSWTPPSSTPLLHEEPGQETGPRHASRRGEPDISA